MLVIVKGEVKVLVTTQVEVPDDELEYNGEELDMIVLKERAVELAEEKIDSLTHFPHAFQTIVGFSSNEDGQIEDTENIEWTDIEKT